MIEGMDVVRKISEVPTQADKPIQEVKLISVKIVTEEAGQGKRG